MGAYYLDSSALTKRYVAERGTVWVTDLVDPAAGNALWTVSLTVVEVTAAEQEGLRVENPNDHP